MHIIFSFCLVHFGSFVNTWKYVRLPAPPPTPTPTSGPPAGQCQPPKQISTEQCGAVELCTDVFTRTRGPRIQMQCENTDPPFNPQTTESVSCSETWAPAKDVGPLRATRLACTVHFLGQGLGTRPSTTNPKNGACISRHSGFSTSFGTLPDWGTIKIVRLGT